MSKYKSPTSNELVGADDAILYLLANVFTSVMFVAVVLMFVALDATEFTFDMFVATVFTLVIFVATVETSVALGCNLWKL